MDGSKAKPFFLYLAFNAAHTPMHATDARLKKFAGIGDGRRTYAAMMFAMDEAVGKLVAKLRGEKLERNTLAFFFSDNGGPAMPGTTVNGSVNASLRGSKRTTLGGGIRVPFFVKWPARVPAGKVSDAPVIQLDVLPTALAAAGVEPKADWRLGGVNLLPHLNGETKAAPHDALFWRPGAQMAVRKGGWKLVKYDTAAELAQGVSPARLYNLADDIGEKADLAAKKPEKAKELQAAWDRWNEGTSPRSGAAARGRTESL